MVQEVHLNHSQLGTQKHHLKCILCKPVYPSVRNNINAGCHGNCVDMPVRNINMYINPYPTAFPYGNGMVLHFYQQQESSTTKTVHKVINRGLKTYV